MSAIFGCVSFEDQRLPPGTGEAMERALRHWGPDGVAWRGRPHALLGMANLAVIPEALHEAPPEWDGTRMRFATAAARLDNREELCEHFGIPSAERGALADGTLVKMACRQWQDDAPRHLFGDWAFAEWDELRRTLRLCRDQLGNTGLYYHHRPPLFAFASDPQALFALHWVKREVNELKIASYLAIQPFIGERETCWQDVFRLTPGTSLVIGPRDERIQRYWDMSMAAPISCQGDEDCVEGLLERFRAAVKPRLRSRFPVGSTLSAGLDSGAVTALAAQALGDKGLPLTAFTAVPIFPAGHLHPGALTDEWPLAHRVASQFSHVEHQPVDAAAVSPLAGVARSLAIHHAPQHAAANEHWLLGVLDAAREKRIGVMLSGQLGNGSVSWSGGRDRIFHLFASGRWDEGRRAMTQWRQWHGRSWIGALAECLLKPLLRPYRPLDVLTFVRIRPPWSEVAAIHPDFAARLNLDEIMRSAAFPASPRRAMRPGAERKLILERNGTMVGPIWHALGAAFAIDVRDPTADVRLLEFCLGVPNEQHARDGGERMLLRRAMEGILPPEVQWNTQRGKQAADLAFRLLQHADEMGDALRCLERSPHATARLDLPLMRSVWRELQEKVTRRTSLRASTILMRGIMCGGFLEQAESLRAEKKEDPR